MARILQIIPTFDRAGAEKQMVLLARGLRERGWDVHACALTRGGPREEELRSAEIPTQVIGKRWKFDPGCYRQLVRHIKRLAPDLVHTWLFAAGAYGRSAAKQSGVRCLVAGERCVDPWKSSWQWWIDRRLAKQTDAIVTNSEGVRQFGLNHGMPARPWRVIPNGVPLPQRSDVSREELCQELRLPANAKLIGVVGRLWHQKRVDELIWAADLLRVLHDEMRLLVIGDGPERNTLERFARQASDLEHIRFLGERDDVWRILPHLDLYWQGSQYEGQPNAVLEAMAVGIPVIASDIASHRELIESGCDGFLVPITGRAERVKLSDKLLQDAEQRMAIAQAAQTKINEQFSVAAMVDAHESLYRELLDG